MLESVLLLICVLASLSPDIHHNRVEAKSLLPDTVFCVQSAFIWSIILTSIESLRETSCMILKHLGASGVCLVCTCEYCLCGTGHFKPWMHSDPLKYQAQDMQIQMKEGWCHSVPQVCGLGHTSWAWERFQWEGNGIFWAVVPLCKWGSYHIIITPLQFIGYNLCFLTKANNNPRGEAEEVILKAVVSH